MLRNACAFSETLLECEEHLSGILIPALTGIGMLHVVSEYRETRGIWDVCLGPTDMGVFVLLCS